MQPETERHLVLTETAIQRAKLLIDNHGYPGGLRTNLVIAFVAQVTEHHESMLMLIRGGRAGSAFALARSLVEGMYRGLWINFVATEAEIARFERTDEIGLTMTELARSVDTAYRAEGFFEDLKNRSWDALNGYTHTGMLQLCRRFVGSIVAPAYSDQEIYEVTTATTTCTLILMSKFLAVQNYIDDSRAVEQLIETYGGAAAH